VVLSGGDSDGSSGVQAVRCAGGITFAQSLETARFSDMPRHAVETGCIDLVLRANEIAHELIRLGRRLSSETPESGATSDVDGGPGRTRRPCGRFFTGSAPCTAWISLITSARLSSDASSGEWHFDGSRALRNIGGD
jgi:hypothetical protein